MREKFDASGLPDDVLDQLHEIAERKNLDDLVADIEEEMFERVMQRVKEDDEITRWYQWEREKIKMAE